MIGGYFFSLISLSLFFQYYEFEFKIKWLFFILIISTVSQLGDIIISYFKRLSKIKDTGKIIPGHGGLLDRVDGMIFAFPFAWIFLIIGIF
jgi:phosphatidate cytidylyltransferase